MNPLLLFLIGGSGARFLRSLLYQLASGLKLQDINTIKLIIIDSDESNGNYETALTILNDYRKIRQKIIEDNNAFRENDKCNLFYHDVELFDENKKFVTPLNAVKRSLSGIVDYINLTSEQQDFINLMLTENELNDDLSIGFQGRPNMGTIGLEAISSSIKGSSKLNQLLGDTPNLNDLANARFFIVSSMFGGMGASGMPLLVNKFKNNVYATNPIGALCYMHYFRINNGKENNDSKFFPQRTNLAYNHYISYSDKINNLYFIGKDFSNEKGVSFSPGSKDQNNQAHYIEYLSTTALIHFCKNIPRPIVPRNITSYSLHADEKLFANSLGNEYTIVFENYIRLIMIGKYFIDRFEKNYTTDEMKRIHWVKNINFDKFDTEEVGMLNSFFSSLIKYDYSELFEYSGFQINNSKHFPLNIQNFIPHKRYQEKKSMFSKRRYNTYEEIDTIGISDSEIKSSKHIPRLLAMLDKSFQKIYKEVYI